MVGEQLMNETTAMWRGASILSETSENQVGRAPSLMVVEDSPPTARGLAAVFRQAGYEVTTFDSGLAALEFARVHRPAAAIVDIHLPDISGLILSQRLREALGEAAPIVVLSGDGSMEVINSLTHVGATCFFAKPVSGQRLVEYVQGVLREKAAE